MIANDFCGVLMAQLGKEDRLTVIMAAFSCARDVAETVDAKALVTAYDAQTTILWRGMETEHACLMLTGRAQAVTYSAAGQIVLLYTYGPGDLFGEDVALGSTASPTGDGQVLAISPAEVSHFQNHVFIGLIESYGAVALAVSRLLTKRLRQTTQRMIEVSTLSTVGRIHNELLRQARAGADMIIRPVPVLSEFALLVQSTRETVSRTINQLEKRGIIKRDVHGLTIVAPHRLEDEVF
jgi:CRP/FNR family transcriptional regulator, cyclic AMP receptor protein